MQEIVINNFVYIQGRYKVSVKLHIKESNAET